MSRSVTAAAGGAILLLCPLVVNAQTCPTTLTPLTNWYQTSPAFSGINQLRMVLTLRNDETGNFTFNAGNTFDAWSVPTGDPPFVVNAEPVGTVTPGSTFRYDLTFDLSGVPTATALAFRPYDGFSYGTLTPTQASLVSVEMTCVAAAAPTVPDLGLWGLVALAAAVVAVAVWRLRAG